MNETFADLSNSLSQSRERKENMKNTGDGRDIPEIIGETRVCARLNGTVFSIKHSLYARENMVILGLHEREDAHCAGQSS